MIPSTHSRCHSVFLSLVSCHNIPFNSLGGAASQLERYQGIKAVPALPGVDGPRWSPDHTPGLISRRARVRAPSPAPGAWQLGSMPQISNSYHHHHHHHGVELWSAFALELVLRLVAVNRDWLEQPRDKTAGAADKHGTTTMSGSWIFVINPLMIITIQTVIISWRLVYIESAGGETCVCLSEWVIELRLERLGAIFHIPDSSSVSWWSQHHLTSGGRRAWDTRGIILSLHYHYQENCQHTTQLVWNWIVNCNTN